MFWGVLIWKRKAEEALLASGLPYTVRSFSESVLEGKQSNALLFLDQLRLLFSLSVQIVRPGGMERPTDAFKETHNITLSVEDTLFGGLVSNLQVFSCLPYFHCGIYTGL